MPYKDPKKRAARQRVYFQRWYAKNHDKVAARVRRNKEVAVRRAQEMVDRMKDKPCADCGRKFHPVAMDFDHVRGRKVKAVARMVCDGFGLAKIKAEIAKCEVVCAVCHRLRTHLRARP